jgi:hypothetical protein
MTTEIDQIKVSGWNIQVREKTQTENEHSFHRYVLTPDSDISGQEQKVQDICNVAWTDAVKAAYATFKAEQATRGI